MRGYALYFCISIVLLLQDISQEINFFDKYLRLLFESRIRVICWFLLTGQFLFLFQANNDKVRH